MNTSREFDPALVPAVSARLPGIDPLKLREETWVYYDVGRLTHNYTTQAGVFRRLLAEHPFGAVQRPQYRQWLEQDFFTCLERARTLEPLSIDHVDALRETGDPAVLVMDALRDSRLREHPQSAADTRLNDIAERGYNLILTSIHASDQAYLRRAQKLMRS